MVFLLVDILWILLTETYTKIIFSGFIGAFILVNKNVLKIVRYIGSYEKGI